jgi:glycerol-3-phosphate dehydrogenase (NAD(P)+)
MLADPGREVRIWGRRPEVLLEINRDHRLRAAFGDTKLPPSLRGEGDLAAALDGADVVLIAVPSGSIRAVTRAVAQHLIQGAPVAICAKGIEADTGLLMTQVAADALRQAQIGCISGPTFAREVVERHPTAATVAFPFLDADRARPEANPATRLAISLTNGTFRAYVSDDLVGVELGGAVKNVIALACGMIAGAGLGDNTRAAVITRGLAEMMALAEAMGARRETLTGLSGLGDLTLTCTSPTSRNMSLGLQLGQGVPRARCFEGRAVVVEGEANARSVTDLARKQGVAMPICEAVRAVLHEGAEMHATFRALLERPLKAEPFGMDLSFAHPSSDRA